MERKCAWVTLESDAFYTCGHDEASHNFRFHWGQHRYGHCEQCCLGEDAARGCDHRFIDHEEYEEQRPLMVRSGYLACSTASMYSVMA